MKNINLLFAALAAVAMLLAACNKPVETGKPSLKVSPQANTLTFTSGASESYEFTVTTNQPSWNAESDRDWCIVTKDAKNNTFKVTAKKNEQDVRPEPATVTVTAGKAEPVRITAEQSAFSVYICGSYGTEEKTTACIWVNGKRTDLEVPASEQAVNTKAHGIAVSQGTVYVLGSYAGKGNPYQYCYWIDGKFNKLNEKPETSNSVSYGIAAEDGNFYIYPARVKSEDAKDHVTGLTTNAKYYLFRFWQ